MTDNHRHTGPQKRGSVPWTALVRGNSMEDARFLPNLGHALAQPGDSRGHGAAAFPSTPGHAVVVNPKHCNKQRPSATYRGVHAWSLKLRSHCISLKSSTGDLSWSCCTLCSHGAPPRPPHGQSKAHAGALPIPQALHQSPDTQLNFQQHTHQASREVPSRWKPGSSGGLGGQAGRAASLEGGPGHS